MRATHLVKPLIVGAAVVLAACHHAHPAPESRVKSVVARIDGITCPTCVPPLTNSLKKQFGQAAVEVDDDKDTASVQFAADEEFSPASFRAAVERVKMRVVTVRVQACGTVEQSNGSRWLTSGANRFAVTSDQELPVGKPLCVDGTLDTRAEPAVFQVSAFSLQNSSSGS